MALQPVKRLPNSEHIYNSRNCYGLIANDFKPITCFNLQQQKLLWPYSPYDQYNEADSIYNSRNCYGLIAIDHTCASHTYIYNSRNCYGLIAIEAKRRLKHISTIVEIVMALQPIAAFILSCQIYNSRNCYGLIARYYTLP